MGRIDWLAAVALEFFWGEALYALDEQLARLRKWRCITMCLPVSGLILISFAAAHGAERIAASRIRELGIASDLPMSRVEYSIERTVSNLAELRADTTSMRVEIAVMGAKLDLLMGAAAIQFVSLLFAFFYQLRLRRTLRGIEN